MIIDSTKTGQTTLATAQSARASTAPSASLFSTALASATTKATASSDTSSAGNVSTSTKVPKGEKTEHVKDHAYDEVIAGPRDGMFINRSGNKRNGQAFAMVKRDGREFHVYGAGKNRVIVEVKHKKDDDTANTTTPTDNQSNSSSGSGTTTTSPATDTTGAPAA